MFVDLNITIILKVSEDDSYTSDVSDNISMDNFSNGTEMERSNSGTKMFSSV